MVESGITFHICDSLKTKNDTISIGHGSFLGMERPTFLSKIFHIPYKA